MAASDSELESIIAAVRRQDRPAAMSQAIEALTRGLEHPLVLLLAAEGLEDRGEDRQALELLHKATHLAPDEAEGWRRLGVLLAKKGMLNDAVAAFDEALDIDPDTYPTLVAAGAASFRMGNLTAAKRHYSHASRLAPRQAEPLTALAAIAARRENAAEARSLAERALALGGSDHPGANMALARADFLDGSADLAVARATRVLDQLGPDDEARLGVLDLRSEALDKLDQTNEAFADYLARNQMLSRLQAPAIMAGLPERRLGQALRLAAQFEGSTPRVWRWRAGEDAIGNRTARGHAFLLGFPRSGTTLVEKALAGHPDVATLEEVDHLSRAGGHLLRDEAGLRRLSILGDDEAAAYRETYWRAVQHTLDEDLEHKLVVDKLPLHTLALPLIAKLFPDARILFAVRDPRDVVLSCFRRRFQLNAAMYEFLELEGAARYYDAVMALAVLILREHSP